MYGHQLQIVGPNLVFPNLFNTATRVVMLNPTLFGPAATSIDLNNHVTFTGDLTVTAANYLDTAWSSGGWNLADLDTQVAGFARLNTSPFDVNQDRAYVLFQTSIGGNNYTIAFLYPADQGTITPSYMIATGGTITTDGDFRVHTFTANGTFTVTTAPGDAVIEYLVVGGGGSGGSFGGGGGGGVRTGTNFPVTKGPLSVVIGAASAQTLPRGTSGNISSLGAITALGGGGGGGASTNAADFPLHNAASGGGGTGLDFVSDPGRGDDTQGNAGGVGSQNGIGTQGAGGGGGGANPINGTVKFNGTATIIAGGAQNVVRFPSTASFSAGDIMQFQGDFGTLSRTISTIVNGTDVTITPIHGVSASNISLVVRVLSAGTTLPGNGGNAPNFTTGGAGGVGRSSSIINGTPVVYGSGAGGGAYIISSSGTAGLGGSGAGNGGRNGLTATSGTANRGGGGGGTGLISAGTSNGLPGAGSSGIVVVRYKFKN